MTDEDGLIVLPENAPHDFRSAVRSLRRATPRPGVVLDEIAPPQRLAPWSFGYTVEAPLPDTEDLASGRLVLLHDPVAHEAWDGTFRLVAYVTADLESEIADDPLYSQVTWDSLAEALDLEDAAHTALGGTVTATVSKRYGDLAGPADTCDVEVRASWTPTTLDVGLHLQAWCSFVAQTAGLPPPGVSMFRKPAGAP